MNAADVKKLMALLPQPAPEIQEIGYCQERKQTFIALKKPEVRLVLRAGQLHYLRIDTVGGSPDIYFTVYKEAAYHEFYQPSKPEMSPPVFLRSILKKRKSHEAATELTDAQVALHRRVIASNCVDIVSNET